MIVLVYFIEITEYNLALIHQVYGRMEEYMFIPAFGTVSVSGHETSEALPDNAIVLQGDSSAERIADLRRALQTHAFDFAIINGYSDPVNAWLIHWCRRHGIPYAIESDTQLNVPKKLIKRLLKRVYLKHIFQGNAYGFAGGSRQTELFRHYGMREDHVFIMPMSVDTDAFRMVADACSKEQHKAKLGYAGKKIALYVGRFAPEKNLSLLIRAAASLLRDHPELELVLVGKGPEQSLLQSEAESLGIENRVVWVPYQKMPTLAEYYAAADVFVLPSSFEPWGLVVNEALACRIPVLASDACGCVDDLIHPGANGDIFPKNDANALSGLLERWLFSSECNLKWDAVSAWNYDLYRRNLRKALDSILQ